MKKILLGILLSILLVSCKERTSISINENKQSVADTSKTARSNFDLLQGRWKNVGTRTEILIDGDKYAENVLGDFKDYTSEFILSDTCSHAPSEISHQKFLHVNSGTFEGCYKISELTTDTLKLLMLGTAHAAVDEVYVKVTPRIISFESLIFLNNNSASFFDNPFIFTVIGNFGGCVSSNLIIWSAVIINLVIGILFNVAEVVPQ